jgi:hypothetical protein
MMLIALVIAGAAPVAAGSPGASPCEVIARGALPEGASLDPALAHAYATDDGACLARVSIAMLARHQTRSALTVARRAKEVAASEPLAYLARGLAEASTLGTDTASLGRGYPQACDSRRLVRVVDDLSVGVFLVERDVEVARATLAALDDLAIQCADPGMLLALSATVRLTYPEIAQRPVAGGELDGRGGALSGQIIAARAALEVAGAPKEVPVLVRRMQYRWLLDTASRGEPRYVLRPAGELLANALLTVDRQMVRDNAANAGRALEDLGLLARLGALHRPALVASAAEWLPKLGHARLGSVERAMLQELEARLALHEESPQVALLAFNVRMISALHEVDPCQKGRALLRAVSRFSSAARELAGVEHTALLQDAARSGREAANECPSGPSTTPVALENPPGRASLQRKERPRKLAGIVVMSLNPSREP